MTQAKNFLKKLHYREYAFFYTLLSGIAIMNAKNDLVNSPSDWDNQMSLVCRWREGWTGIPIIDALMRELHQTGRMSNFGRQLTASFLTNDLNVDWRCGLHFLRDSLVDHNYSLSLMGWH